MVFGGLRCAIAEIKTLDWRICIQVAEIAKGNVWVSNYNILIKTKNYGPNANDTSSLEQMSLGSMVLGLLYTYFAQKPDWRVL